MTIIVRVRSELFFSKKKNAKRVAEKKNRPKDRNMFSQVGERALLAAKVKEKSMSDRWGRFDSHLVQKNILCKINDKFDFKNISDKIY